MGIAFEISHHFTGFWHLMTCDMMNQTSEVLTDAHMSHGSLALQCTHRKVPDDPRS